MNARVVLDVWFDTESMTEDEVRDLLEDALDAYYGSTYIHSIELTSDED